MPRPAVRTAPDPGAVAGRLRLPITRLARQLRQQDRSGLTPSLTATLSTIGRDGPLTLGDLASKEGVAPPTITRMVVALEERGFVARRSLSGDRRVCHVELTPEGARELDENRSRRTAWLAGRLERLTRPELESLAAAAEVLERIALHDEQAVTK